MIWCEHPRKLRASTLVACAIVAFVTLRSVAAAVALILGVSHIDAGVFEPRGVAVNCVNQLDRGHAPDNSAHNDGVCCAFFCSAGWRDDATLAPERALDWVVTRAERAQIRIQWRAQCAQTCPAGWASSWSSRAPPLFS
jgi:hypothetical protein